MGGGLYLTFLTKSDSTLMCAKQENTKVSFNYINIPGGSLFLNLKMNTGRRNMGKNVFKSNPTTLNITTLIAKFRVLHRNFLLSFNCNNTIKEKIFIQNGKFKDTWF